MKKIQLLITYFIIMISSITILINSSTTIQANVDRYIIATDETFAPFVFQNSSGELVGIDMELFSAIAQDQGFEYEMRPLGFNAAIQALEGRQVDGVIAGMSITEERRSRFDFSDPYFDSGIVMAVREDNYNIQTYEDLKGKNVAVKIGTKGHDFASSIKDKYGFTLVLFDDSASMYEEVRTGNSVACFDDYPVLAFGIHQGNGLKIITEKEEAGEYGFAVRRGENQELLAKFNQGLQNIKDSGEYQQIIDNYVGGDIPTYTFFDTLTNSFPSLLSGLWKTIELTFISLIVGTLLGLIFGFFKVSHNKLLKGIGTVYVDIIRGVPLIVLAFFIYFGIPQGLSIRIDPTLAAIITLSLNAGAYITEIIRGGILAIDSGQMEAARSLGIPYSISMRKVILPQAIKVMIPSFINQFIITLKDTSIMSVIGIVELTQSGKIIIARTFETTGIWAVVAIMYLILIIILTKVSDILERRLN